MGFGLPVSSMARGFDPLRCCPALPFALPASQARGYSMMLTPSVVQSPRLDQTAKTALPRSGSREPTDTACLRFSNRITSFVLYRCAPRLFMRVLRYGKQIHRKMPMRRRHIRREWGTPCGRAVPLRRVSQIKRDRTYRGRDVSFGCGNRERKSPSFQICICHWINGDKDVLSHVQQSCLRAEHPDTEPCDTVFGYHGRRARPESRSRHIQSRQTALG